jgi:hypothetical protein
MKLWKELVNFSALESYNKKLIDSKYKAATTAGILP